MGQNGNNIIVKADGVAIAGCKTTEIEVGGEMIEVSSATEKDWKHYIGGRKSWSFQTGYLVMSGSALSVSGGSGLRDLLQVDSEYDIVVMNRSVNGDSLSGRALLKQCKISAVRGSLVSGSFSFVGDGPLT